MKRENDFWKLLSKMRIDFIAFYFVSELILFLVFKKIRKCYLGSSGTQRPMWNGVIERIFLYICLFSGVYHGLVLFGALKIGTRIKSDEDKISNDYFLIGNMVSVGAVILSFHLYKIWIN